jgi:hypothetical protein
MEWIAADKLRELRGREPVCGQGDRGAAVLGQPGKMLFYKHGDFGVEGDLVSTTWCSPRVQCLDERILGKFAVLVVLVEEQGNNA